MKHDCERSAGGLYGTRGTELMGRWMELQITADLSLPANPSAAHTDWAVTLIALRLPGKLLGGLVECDWTEIRS